MSAGHQTEHHESAALGQELARLLADARVKKLMQRAYRVDFSHPMPLTGGSTVTWDRFFLDPRLKQRFSVGQRRDVDLSEPVLRHEVVEKALRQVLGMSYDRAHVLATLAERQVVKAMKLDWNAYKRVMSQIVRRDESERPKSMPKDFDYGPVRASRGLKSLKWLQRAA